MGLFSETETERFGRMVAMGAMGGLTELQFFAKEIKDWKQSKRRMDQLCGIRYYNGLHDILNRQRKIIGKDGKLVTVHNLPNHKIVDNQYAMMVDQKTNYLVGKPFTISGDDQAAVDRVNTVLNRRFRRTLKYSVEDAINCGISWMYPYYDRGELLFRRLSGCEVLPFWADDEHTILDAACRLYTQEVYLGVEKKKVERVELFKEDGLYRYILENDMLYPDDDLGRYSPYFTDGESSYNWGRIPLIPIKYNQQETPLINRVKSLQDGINELLSDFQNNMQEDARNTILVLKNYDGQNLEEFRQNLSQFGVVKVRGDGDVVTLTVEVNSGNYNAILKLLKDKLIENAKGYDGKDDRLSGTPNQMNIQSMYSDIDQDANGMETELQAAFEELLWFVTGSLQESSKPLNVVFNRDVLINESEAIENCRKSVGILSTETIVEQHPWVVDVQTELRRLEQERALLMDDYGLSHTSEGEE